MPLVVQRSEEIAQQVTYDTTRNSHFPENAIQPRFCQQLYRAMLKVIAKVELIGLTQDREVDG